MERLNEDRLNEDIYSGNEGKIRRVPGDTPPAPPEQVHAASLAGEPNSSIPAM